jgi:hypothetical protein
MANLNKHRKNYFVLGSCACFATTENDVKNGKEVEDGDRDGVAAGRTCGPQDGEVLRGAELGETPLSAKPWKFLKRLLEVEEERPSSSD